MKIIKYNKCKNIIFCGFIAGLIGAASICPSCNITSALTYQDNIDIQFTFNPVIRIDLSDSELLISNLAPGAVADSNVITVSTATNASYGYQLSATVGAKGGTDALVNSVDNTKTFTNLASNKATLTNFDDNTWGYSYCADTAANCSNSGSASWVSGSVGNTTDGYAGLPLDDNDDSSLRGQGGVTLLSTDGSNNGSVVQFKIGAKAGANQASGVYNNTINFYAVANPEPELEPVECEAGKICYNVNSLGPTEGTMGKQDQDNSGNAIVDGSRVTLLASNFSRTGYGFAGWNTEPDYTGTFYGPNETITTPTGTATNGLSLYAIWVPSAGNMQNWQGCPGLPSGGVIALKDQRDGQVYAVSKLLDGKCWMIENLRLDSTNTDNMSGSLAEGYGVSSTYGNFSGLAMSEYENFFNSTSANSLYYSGAQEGAAIIDIGTSNYPGYRMPRYNNTNTKNRAQNNPNTNTDNMYSYGNYYTWHAAIADLTHNGIENQSTVNTSLCPKGWHIPSGGMAYASDNTGVVNVTNKPETFRELYNLGYAIMGYDKTAYDDTPNSGNSYYGSNTINSDGDTASIAFRKYPNNYVYSGYYGNSSTNSLGLSGTYWSSTSNRDGYSNGVNINNISINPGTYSFIKLYGRSIRCLRSS